MSDIYLFNPNETDFSGLGEAGSMSPLSVIHNEVKNGMSELEIVHSFDEMEKWTFLQNGWNVIADVPVRTTPEIDAAGALVTTIEKWKVKNTAPVIIRKLYNKEDTTKQKVLATLKLNQSVTVVRKGDARYKVKTGKYSGWIDRNALEFEIVEVIPNDPNAIQEAVPPNEIRPQRFRIYKVVRDSKNREIIAYAKHAFYDQTKNVTSYSKSAATALETMNGLIAGCASTNYLRGQTNILDVRAAVKWERAKFVESILDPETGMTALWNLEIVRDNDEFTLLRNAGMNRGVRIEYGKNLRGVKLTLDESTVVTRYVPVGQAFNGKPLVLIPGTYTTEHGTITITEGQYWIDSPNIGDYDVPHVEVLDLSAIAKPGLDTEQQHKNARELMIDACLDAFEDGKTIYPAVTLEVDFQQLGYTDEYAQYRLLETVYLYDWVTIYHPGIGVDVLAQVVEYEWNVGRNCPGKIVLGSIDPRRVGRMVPVWRVPNELPGAKVGAGGIGEREIADGAVKRPEIVSPGVIIPVHMSVKMDTWFAGLAKPIESAISSAEGRLATAEGRIEDAEGNIATLTTEAGLLASDMADAKGNISTLQQTAGEIILAVGEKLDADAPAAGVTASGIDIRAGIVSISTPVFAVNVEGTNGDMSLDETGLSIGVVTSPSVLPKYFGAGVVYVNPDAEDAQVEAGNYFRSLKSALELVTRKFLPSTLTIVMTTGTYYEGEFLIAGVIGQGKLRIDCNGSVFRNTAIQFVGCTVQIEFIEFTIHQLSTTKNCLIFDSCAMVNVNDGIFNALTGTTGSYAGILARYGTKMYITACQFYGAWRAVTAIQGVLVVLYNCKGNSKLYVGAGLMIVEGTQPCDTTTFGIGRAAAGHLIQSGTVTVDQGTATPPEPEVATATYAATTTRTVYGSAEWPGTWKSETGEFWQGFTSSQSHQVGLMWFNGVGAVNGKTIQSAKLRFRRVSGIGKGDDVKVVAYYGDRAYNAGSGSPANRVSMGTIGYINNGETIEVAVPTAAVSYLAASPTGRCIAFNPSDSSVLSGKTYSSNYAKFYGVGSGYTPELIVTYTP